MLISFAATNYRSICERQVFNFRAATHIDHTEMIEHLIPFKKEHLLKSGIVYGANAAGKSNFFKALGTLQILVLHSNTYQLEQPIAGYNPFKLDKQHGALPTFLEIEFIAKDQKKYVYEVGFNQKQIVSESLFFYANDKSLRKSLLYMREKNQATVFGDAYRGKRDFFLNENQLLLSKAGVELVPILHPAFRFFRQNLILIPVKDDSLEAALLNTTAELLIHKSFNEHKQNIISIIKAADIGIANIFVQRNELESTATHRKNIKFEHYVFEADKMVGTTVLELSEQSEGTRKLLGIASILVAALLEGETVIIDELDTHLHPLVTRMLIKLFHQTDTNPNNAQLIFSTQDVSLIDKDLFRRDQIYFVDKQLQGHSTIGRLSDFKGVSKVVPLTKWYLLGLFSGVPAVNDAGITLTFQKIANG
jgi:AAA15 family ATPase/GTPase